jgi:predicted nucleotidyltransferase
MQLQEIEASENVRIVYACESGSRAWGFPSADSDFDVRFLYVHTAEWYLSIHEKRDVIEHPVDDGLDISGWDLKKALLLFRKSNPPFWSGLARLSSILKSILLPPECGSLPQCIIRQPLAYITTCTWRAVTSENT